MYQNTPSKRLKSRFRLNLLGIFPCPSRCGTGFTTSTALAGWDPSLRAPGTARTLKTAEDGPRDVSERLCSRKETSRQAKRRAFTIRLPCSTLDTARYLYYLRVETVFVILLRSPGIDSQPGGPVQQSYLSYRPARLQRLGGIFPQGSLNVYKYGIWLPGTVPGTLI